MVNLPHQDVIPAVCGKNTVPEICRICAGVEDRRPTACGNPCGEVRVNGVTSEHETRFGNLCGREVAFKGCFDECCRALVSNGERKPTLFERLSDPLSRRDVVAISMPQG